MNSVNNVTAAILVEYKRLHDEFLELSFDLYAVDGRPKLSIPHWNNRAKELKDIKEQLNHLTHVMAENDPFYRLPTFPID